MLKVRSLEAFTDSCEQLFRGFWLKHIVRPSYWSSESCVHYNRPSGSQIFPPASLWKPSAKVYTNRMDLNVLRTGSYPKPAYCRKTTLSFCATNPFISNIRRLKSVFHTCFAVKSSIRPRFRQTYVYWSAHGKYCTRTRCTMATTADPSRIANDYYNNMHSSPRARINSRANVDAFKISYKNVYWWFTRRIVFYRNVLFRRVGVMWREGENGGAAAEKTFLHDRNVRRDPFWIRFNLSPAFKSA